MQHFNIVMVTVCNHLKILCVYNIQAYKKIFNNTEIRSVWNKEDEKYYISIVDVIGVLSESDNPQVYWRVLKKRLLAEGNETVTNCNGLKLKAKDGKYRLTDVCDI